MRALFLAFIALGISAPTVAAYICWVDHVEQHNEELRVFMRPTYIYAVRGITHPDGTRSDFERYEDGFFTLKIGDSAGLVNFVHDSCTAKAVILNKVQGLELKATSCTRGDCRHATAFAPAE